jgi:predicted nucleic acid-binding protein
LRNVLATYMRTSRLTLVQATEIMEAALELLAGREYQVMSPDVLRLAAESGCSAYDGEFVALAEALAVPLVTHDRHLLRAFPAIAMTAADFCADA